MTSTQTCTCAQPDWYHDGVSSFFNGRRCRRCRLREGYNADVDPYNRDVDTQRATLTG